MRRKYVKGPPKLCYETGPNCDGCPYRSTSFGYVPHDLKGDSDYLFILGKADRAEITSGRNIAGGYSSTFNTLLHENTPLRRMHISTTLTVRCRPVEWVECSECKGLGGWTGASDNMDVIECVICGGEGQVPAVQEDSKDHVKAKASPGQIRECGERYLSPLLEQYEGKHLVALGAEALAFMQGRPMKVSDYRGTTFEPGVLVECEKCGGSGKVDRKPIKCKFCQGRGTVQCEMCRRWKAHTKKCPAYGNPEVMCDMCKPPGSGKYPLKPRACKECEGSGKVPADPENPYVCEKLKPHQLLYVTYAPGMVQAQPTMWDVVERDFSRLCDLEAELVVQKPANYNYYPPDDDAEYLAQADELSIDLETSGGFDPTTGNIICFGVTDRVGGGCVLDPDSPLARRCLNVPQIVGQNFILYDWWWLHNHGYTISPKTKIWDTRYAGKLLNPDTPNDLTYLAGEFASPPVRGYWKTKQNYRDDIERVCAIDVDTTLRVKRGQYDALRERGQLKIMEDFIMPLSLVTFDMRSKGMKINKEKMDRAGEIIREDLQEKRMQLPDIEAWKPTKHGYRTENQHAAVQGYLYNTLKLPIQTKRGSGGKTTANQEALDELRGRLETDHKSIRRLTSERIEEALCFIELIDTCRDLSKLETSFLKYKVSPSNFVHPALNMGGSTRGKHEAGRGTATFRFSCSDPNAQQIPGCKCKPKCFGTNPDCRGARDIFIPDYEDWEVMSVDLKQAEVVGFLWYAEAYDVLDKVLREGMDAHQMVADKILAREATKNERDDFKTTTFAILYGEHERTTAARLHRGIEDIREAREYYFHALPGVPEYRRMQITSAMDKGYVESPFGLRRYMRLQSERGRAANQACNMPIQNIPPTVIGRAMIKIHQQLPDPARLWMQVHDEILCVYPKELRTCVYECVVENLRQPVPEMSAAPLGMSSGLVFNCDVEIGPHWGALRALHEVTALEKIGEDPWVC